MIPSGIAIKQYTGNGSTTIFSFPFYIYAAAEIQVWSIDTTDPTDTETLVGSGYTVNGVGTDTGNITYTVAPPLDTRITIIRVPVQEQQTDYVANENIPADAHEEQIDKIVAMIQSLQEQIDRCIQLPRSIAAAFDPVVDVLPPGANRALFSNSGVDGFDWSSSDLSDLDANVAATAADVVATNADVVATNADVVSTNADVVTTAASAAAAAASAALAATNAANLAASVNANYGSWNVTSATQVVIDNGFQFRGVDSGQVFTFTSSRTFDITGTAGTLGSLNTGSEAANTFYYLIALGDTTGVTAPHIIGVSAANYTTFTTADLTGNYAVYDDYKRIGAVENDAASDLILMHHLNHTTYFDDPDSDATIQFSSATFTDEDVSIYVPPIARELTVCFHNSSGTIYWRFNGSSGAGIIVRESSSANEVQIVLDENQIFEVKTSAGTPIGYISSYKDNLLTEDNG